MTDVPAVTKLAVWLGEAIGISEELFADFSTEVLGVELPDSVIASTGVTTALSHAETAAKAARTASEGLESAAASGGDAQHLAAFVTFGGAVGSYFNAIANLVTAVDSAITTGSVPDATARAAAQSLANNLAKKLADLVIVTTIAETVPELAYLLKLLGLAEWGFRASDDASTLDTDHVEMQLHLERLADLFDDPAKHFRTAFKWGDAGFDPSDFFAIYAQFFHSEHTLETGIDGVDPFLRHGDVTIRRASDRTPPGLRVAFNTEYAVDEKTRIDINDDWGFNLTGKLTFSAGASALIEAPLDIDVTTTADANGEVRLFVDRNDEADPLDLLGGTGLLSLDVDDASIGVGIDAEWNAGTGIAAVEPLIFAAIKGATLAIGSKDADGFIGELLSSADIKGNFDLTVEWSPDDGLRVQGSGGFEIKLPIHKSLGIAQLDSLYLALRIASDGTLELETSAAVTGKFGPLSAAVDRLGATLDLNFVDDTSGDLGLFDLDLAFKPPTGVGLSIDAAVVKGGGYLYFDPEKEEYAGALELVLVEFITVKAIGLVTTRLPDGSKGFSLLLIITAEFGSGIQLGFGFTLLGVGGLLGVNRTMKLQPLIDGVRTGAVQSVMFPKDVVANAPRIISDLRKFFPPAKGIFLIGPMAKIGWSTPPLITLSLGVIIEIPGNVAIVGVLKVALPDEKAPLILLQVNFVGAIEFDKKRAWLFAGLFESRVVGTTLEGEMGVLVSWGAQASFLVSVGGFHPQYKPPPLPFSSLKRVTNNILNAAYGRIRVAGYFAVTSNTVQFGARAELYFGLSEVRIDGHVGFDALFQFNPFYFIIEISGSVSLKVFGMGLFSISLKFSLEGPSPWRAKGYGKLKILFFSIKARFDFTWGPKKDTTLPPIKVMPMLVAEYQKLDNWRPVVPKSNRLSVSLRELPTGTTNLVLHPLGQLGVSQRAVPLDIDIAKVGSRKPSDGKRFSVSVTGGLSKTRDIDESFAIGQFKDLKDAEKLSKPAFQPLTGGLEAAPSDRTFETGNATMRNLRYETHIIDKQRSRLVIGLFGYVGSLFAHLVNGNAASQSVMSKHHQDQLTPFEEKIVVQEESYAVAFNKDNTTYAAGAVFASQAQAETFLEDELATDPSLDGSLQVVSAFELVGSP